MCYFCLLVIMKLISFLYYKFLSIFFTTMSGQNKNVSRKKLILSLAPTESYDQIQATLNLLFTNDLEFDTV
jgi:hypothetical protein